MWKTKSLSISLDFQNKSAIITKGSLFLLQAKHKRRMLGRSSVLMRERDSLMFAENGMHVVQTDTNFKWLTWHYVADRDKSCVLQTGKITEQLPIKHAIPVSNRVVLKKLETCYPYNPQTAWSIWTHVLLPVVRSFSLIVQLKNDPSAWSSVLQWSNSCSGHLLNNRWSSTPGPSTQMFYLFFTHNHAVLDPYSEIQDCTPAE